MRKVMEVTFKVAIDRYPDSSQILLSTLAEAERLGLIEDFKGEIINTSFISFYNCLDKDKKRGE